MPRRRLPDRSPTCVRCPPGASTSAAAATTCGSPRPCGTPATAPWSSTGSAGSGEDVMDAYQYFFDGDGNQTGLRSWSARCTGTAGGPTSIGTSRTSRVTRCSPPTRPRGQVAQGGVLPGEHGRGRPHRPQRRSGTRSTPTCRRRAATRRRCRSGRCWPRAGVTPTSSSGPDSRSTCADCRTAVFIAVIANPENRLVEASKNNNVALRKVFIGGTGAPDRSGAPGGPRRRAIFGKTPLRRPSTAAAAAGQQDAPPPLGDGAPWKFRAISPCAG